MGGKWVMHIILIFLGNCKTEKIETSLLRSPLDQSCPQFWTFDPTYPNICYHTNRTYLSWDDATDLCHRLNPQATLPIFHDLSEYISYSKWAYGHRLPSLCILWSWLGISYNTTSKNYSWIDGSDVSFNFYDHNMVIEERYRFYYNFFGSNKWKQYEKTSTAWYTVCQLRINKNSLLNTTSTVSLDYPKSRKCPQKENWFYDKYSDICYYYNRHDSRNWTSALAHCKSEVGGSLPHFIAENEVDSFVNLTRTLHVYCRDGIWLGYYGQNSSFINVNGSANSFLKWLSGYPKIHSTISYVYFEWDKKAFRNEDSEMEAKSVFCQCRSGSCKTEKID